MSKDPGLFTDSTGEGMSGAEDLSLLTQQKMKKTYYNGTKPCLECGLELDPYQSLHSQYCPHCTQRQAIKLVHNRMVK